MELLEIGLLELERDGLISDITETGSRLLGFSSPSELRGNVFIWELFERGKSLEERKGIFDSFLSGISRGTGVASIDVRFSPPYGRDFMGVLMGTLVREGDEERILSAIFKLPPDKELLLSICRDLPVAFFRIGNDNRFEFIDEMGSREIFGCPSDHLIGKSVREIHFIEDVANGFFEELMKALSTKRRMVRVSRVILKRADGSPVVVTSLVRGVYDRNGELVGREGIILREDFLNIVGEGLDVESYSRFLGVLSHDVKSLCGSALSFLEMLSETELDARQADLVNKAYASLEGARRVLDNLISSYRIQYGKIDLIEIPFDLLETVDYLKTVVSPYVRRGVELSFKVVELPYLLIGDGQKLEQILLNLLVNSAKVTQEGFIELRVELLKEDNEEVELLFSVRDTGPGIPKDMKGKLFLPFRRFSSSYEGLGLGLYISKSLANIMGGDLWLGESERGALFQLRLPFRKGESKEEVPFL